MRRTHIRIFVFYSLVLKSLWAIGEPQHSLDSIKTVLKSDYNLGVHLLEELELSFLEAGLTDIEYAQLEELRGYMQTGRSNYIISNEYYYSALSRYTRIEDKARIFTYLGQNFYSIGARDSSLFYYNKALEYYKFDTSSVAYLNLQLLRVALLATTQEYQTSINQINNLISKSKLVSGAEEVVATAYVNLIQLHSWIGDEDMLTEYLDSAFKYFSTVYKPDSYEFAQYYIIAAKTSRLSAQPVYRPEFIDKAVEIYRRIGSQRGLVECQIEKSYGNLLLGRQAEAFACLDSAILISKSANLPLSLRSAFLAASTIYHRADNLELAYEYLISYYQLNDSLLNDDFKSNLDIYKARINHEKELHGLRQTQLIKENEYYQNQRILLIVITILVLVALLFMFVYYRNRLQKTFLSRELQRFRNLAFLTQINPHFIFNCLNSIQYCINNEDYVAANKYLLHFSKFVRIMLKNSDKEFIPIEEEIETIQYYINLESLRFDKKIKLGINVDNNLRDKKIPPALIQPLIENSVVHGFLANEKEVNLIDIRLSRTSSGTIHVEVTDNGNRIEEPSNNPHSEDDAHGLKIVQDRLEAIFKLYKCPPEFRIRNISPIGVQVSFNVPMID